MSIVKELMENTGLQLVIPKAGKMFFSNVSKRNKALGLVLNKGYFRSESKEDLNRLFEYLPESKKNIFVGAIDEVKLGKNKDRIDYRQRIFFKDLNYILELCKKFGVAIVIPQDFRVNINNTLNVVEYLKYLEVYARKFDEDIDVYLTNILLIRLNTILKSKHIPSNLDEKVEKILKNKRGYFDKAPFLISSYSIDDKTSAIFLEADLKDNRLFSLPIEDKLNLVYGFTTENIKLDRKKGIFHG